MITRREKIPTHRREYAESRSPASSSVVRLYWPRGFGSFTANFTSAPNMLDERNELQNNRQTESSFEKFPTLYGQKFHTMMRMETIPCTIRAA